MTKRGFMRKQFKQAGRFATQYAPLLLCMVAATTTVFAQTGSGDISSSTEQLLTLEHVILKVVLALAGAAFVGLIVWGGVTLAVNRVRGLAMIAGGIVGALLAGLAFALVGTLTGGAVGTTTL
jgi:hypothetical protein